VLAPANHVGSPRGRTGPAPAPSMCIPSARRFELPERSLLCPLRLLATCAAPSSPARMPPHFVLLLAAPPGPPRSVEPTSCTRRRTGTTQRSTACSQWVPCPLHACSPTVPLPGLSSAVRAGHGVIALTLVVYLRASTAAGLARFRQAARDGPSPLPAAPADEREAHGLGSPDARGAAGAAGGDPRLGAGHDCAFFVATAPPHVRVPRYGCRRLFPVTAAWPQLHSVSLTRATRRPARSRTTCGRARRSSWSAG
jgi:hypothetical protein